MVPAQPTDSDFYTVVDNHSPMPVALALLSDQNDVPSPAPDRATASVPGAVLPRPVVPDVQADAIAETVRTRAYIPVQMVAVNPVPPGVA